MCSSRPTGASLSTAEISTAGTIRIPCCWPAAIASETPLMVSWSDSASCSTPAAAARSTTSAAGRAPSECVECDCRSKRGAMRAGGYAIRSEIDEQRGRLAADGQQRLDPPRERVAQAQDGCVVAPGLVMQHEIGAAAGGLERGAGGVGLEGAHARLDPEGLEIGQRCPEVLLGECAALLELAHDGHQLVDQPMLLAVGAQQQADIGGLVGGGLVDHAGIRARHKRCLARAIAL